MPRRSVSRARSLFVTKIGLLFAAEIGCCLNTYKKGSSIRFELPYNCFFTTALPSFRARYACISRKTSAFQFIAGEVFAYAKVKLRRHSEVARGTRGEVKLVHADCHLRYG